MPKKVGKQVMRIFTHPQMTWVDITEPSAEALGELKRRYPFFLDIDLRDCLPPYQRPKLLQRDQYLFLVLVFPVFDYKTRTIQSAELDVFIGRDFIVTNHSGKLRPLMDAAASFEGNQNACPMDTINCPANWLHSLLSSLLTSTFPMLTHIGNDISSLETELFRETNGDTVKEILRVKSNIVDFRRIMQGHKHVIERFMDLAPKILSMTKLEVYYEDLVGHTKEIWDFLENDKNTIDAVYESYLSLITYESSQATKTLTALAFIIFPATLTATIFAMKADFMPFSGMRGDFWLMCGVVFMVAAGTAGYLRSKKWL
jgi:magnesium transporter